MTANWPLDESAAKMALMAAQAKQARGARRGRRRLCGVAAVLAAAWLAGRGFMAGHREPAAGAATVGGAVASSSAAVASVPPDPLPPPPARDEPAVDAGLDPDRFASMLDAVLALGARDEFADAATALAHLLAQPLSATQRDAAERAGAVVRDGVLDRIRAVAELLERGRAIAAVRAWRSLVPPGAPAPRWIGLLPDAVRAAALAAAGAELHTDASLPTPRPIGRGRTVTAWVEAGSFVGVTVASDAGHVTLRIAHDDGATYPTVPYAACEPHEPQADEAIECGIAAARAGDALLARAWSLVARSRGGADGERWRRLDACVR